MLVANYIRPQLFKQPLSQGTEYGKYCLINSRELINPVI